MSTSFYNPRFMNDPDDLSYQDDYSFDSEEELARRKRAALIALSPEPSLDSSRIRTTFTSNQPETEEAFSKFDPTSGLSSEERNILVGAPGERYSRYMDWAKENPPPTVDQFKPSLSAKILAAMAGFKYGMQGRGDLAIEVGRKIREAPYEQAMSKYRQQELALRSPAQLEERERSIARRQMTSQARMEQSKWKTEAGAFEKHVKGEAAAGARALENKWTGKLSPASTAKVEAENAREERIREQQRESNARADFYRDLARERENRLRDGGEEASITPLSPTAEKAGIAQIAPTEMQANKGWSDHLNVDVNGNPAGPRIIDVDENGNPKDKKDAALLKQHGKTVDQWNKDAVWLWNELRRKSKETYEKPPRKRVRKVTREDDF